MLFPVFTSIQLQPFSKAGNYLGFTSRYTVSVTGGPCRAAAVLTRDKPIRLIFVNRYSTLITRRPGS